MMHRKGRILGGPITRRDGDFEINAALRAVINARRERTSAEPDGNVLLELQDPGSDIPGRGEVRSNNWSCRPVIQ